MPISKKPWKKAATPKQPTDDSIRPPLPDRRGMEGFMAGLFGGRHGSDPTEAAQDIMYEAWEATTRSKRIALARKALEVSPLCADAYVLLAEEEARSGEEVLDYYQQGVEAGEMALGSEGFEEYAGHFWGFLETRPYMRARAGLAAALWRLGRHQEAMGHYQAMLKLNPNDNQGIRYVLAGHLLARDDIKALKKLIRQYEDDGAAAWLYTQALLAFRENDPDAGRANWPRKPGWPAWRAIGQAASGGLYGRVYHHGRRGRGRRLRRGKRQGLAVDARRCRVAGGSDQEIETAQTTGQCWRLIWVYPA